MIDQVDLEIGVQKDKLTGNRIFAELIFRIGAPDNNSTPEGVAAHMTDTISRSKIFAEKRLVKGIAQVDCSYYTKGVLNGRLAKGSDSMCPASYDATSGMKIIHTQEQDGYTDVTLSVPYTY